MVTGANGNETQAGRTRNGWVRKDRKGQAPSHKTMELFGWLCAYLGSFTIYVHAYIPILFALLFFKSTLLSQNFL